MKCKYLPVKYHDMVKDFPSFSATGKYQGDEAYVLRRRCVAGAVW